MKREHVTPSTGSSAKPLFRDRPRLLVSVRSADEARAAMEGGADIIDIKEPSRGSLGAADMRVQSEVVAAVGKWVPVTAALGELHEPARELAHGVTFFKMGLSNAAPTWQEDLQRRTTRLQPAHAVTVLYADFHRVNAPQPRFVQSFAQRHAKGLLIDTAIKDGRNLFDHWIDDALRDQIQQAHRHGLFVALAGSLQSKHISRCLDLGADVIAVRSAACAHGDRHAPVDSAAVRHLTKLISERRHR